MILTENQSSSSPYYPYFDTLKYKYATEADRKRIYEDLKGMNKRQEIYSIERTEPYKRYLLGLCESRISLFYLFTRIYVLNKRVTIDQEDETYKLTKMAEYQKHFTEISNLINIFGGAIYEVYKTLTFDSRLSRKVEAEFLKNMERYKRESKYYQQIIASEASNVVHKLNFF